MNSLSTSFVKKRNRATRTFSGSVALACSGIGHVNRGYEASVMELFNALDGKINVQLYRGKGNSPGATCRTTVSRHSNLYQFWPFNQSSDYARYSNENRTFALHLLLKLVHHPVDIIFTPDHCLALMLERAKRVLPKSPAVIFSNGAPFDNEFCENFGIVHQKSYEHYEASRGTKLFDRFYLIPNGFDASRLVQPSTFSRSSVLEKYGIDPQAKVVLTLSAHNKAHKRVDWLLSEFAQLDQNKFALIIAGQSGEETCSLKEQSDDLGCNAIFLTVPHDEVPGLIWAADMTTLCSLSEGFPRSLAESMGASRHVFVHPHDNAKWILGDNDFCFVDMEKESALARAIQYAAENPNLCAHSAAINNRRFNDRFAWDKVAQAYIKMFSDVLRTKSCSPQK